ncbi:transketolase [Candidatus Curtissbacteria bacterium RIFCSPHIGHO2_02_FULL_42_15]|uniref:Transketolase n=1 Tax=Candidatus Curtissbacteria bacterium RIFCSPHIGHO2_02_FULL_42_15 TaxID=1797716 RepID=A0A1F5GK77_9BACT|nr:MAG: transketolase [Candidatus Curtissbacteria bacterium RIFCSPHIGHO2_02_FULL_42_15]
MADIAKLEKLAKLVRYYILYITTKAASGHATSGLSAVELMTALFFKYLKYDLENPDNLNNDRVIFSKGHASPLLYPLYYAAGAITEDDLEDYRQLHSTLEGHPNSRFKYVDVATGSLGQGLSVGFGMALASKLFNRGRYKIYVLMGDNEVAEGSVWETMNVATYYDNTTCKIDNLVGILDVNRLGQSGETMFGWKVDEYKKRAEAFGWLTKIIDGHNFGEIFKAFEWVESQTKPALIIAKTVKGKGVSFLENKEGWHGKPLSKEEFERAVAELGKVDKSGRGEIAKPPDSHLKSSTRSNTNYSSSKVEKFQPYKLGEMVATRKAYGSGLTKLGLARKDVVCLDADVKNSTYTERFKEKIPERFLDMFIAEQNMVGTALGLSARGMIPFVSTFATFFTRAFDQIRMTAYSRGNVKFMGSHAGVSIGEDGPSQMGLEDISLFRAVFGSVVLNPSDAVSCEKLVFEAANHQGIVYIRTARPATPVIYEISQDFKIGGSKIVRSSKDDKLTIVACGVVLIEALKAADQLVKKNINARVIDAYSIKPIDESTLKSAAKETKVIITIEDHYPEGGLGDAVLSALANEKVEVHKLSVSKMPMSGKSQELLDYEGISSKAIVKKVLEILYSPC